MEEKITPLTEFERELISRSAAFVAQGIVKNFQFSNRDVLRLIATVEDAEARAKKNADDLRRASGLAINANFRAEKAEAEVARLRERLEAALDKIAEIQDEWESEGVCHACGICAGIPYEWQRPDGFCCRVAVGLWSSKKPLPWEASARRAVEGE